MLRFPESTLIGVIHLPALPGSPAHQLTMDAIVERALADARALKIAGFDAAIVENLGDAPFSAESVEPASLAAMAVAADAVRREVGLPLGINALRNDVLGGLGIAVAVGATFVRVNVHTGVMATDQGIIEGHARRTLNYRRRLGSRIAILADVHVKHATPVSQPDIAEAARDTAYRGLADGLIVTGKATGEPVDPEDLRAVREAVPDRRVFVGSGATVATARSLMEAAGGIIVGSGLKPHGDTSLPIDDQLAREFARAVGRG